MTSPQRSYTTRIQIIVIAILLITVGLGIYYLKKTTPTHKKMLRKERTVLVDTVTLKKQNHTVTITAHGTVTPAEQSSLRSALESHVLWIHPHLQPGEKVNRDEVLIKLDPTDFIHTLEQAKKDMRIAQSNITKAQGDIVNAEYDYAIESGYQAIAQHEWKLLEEQHKTAESDKALILRLPHLKKAQAAIATAQAALVAAQAEAQKAEIALKQAQRDITRTEIRAPFDAVISERSTARGNRVAKQELLATLIRADEIWVEIPLPTQQLSWISFADKNREGSPVQLSLHGKKWQGEMRYLYPELENDGRRARCIASIPHPFTQQKETSPLLINSFVDVTITAKELENIFIVPRDSLHENNIIWIKETPDSGESRLTYRSVTPLFTTDKTVILSTGVHEGDQIITSAISAPAPGMKVHSHE
jgi:RND family efflux transporter MFP subunit